MTAHRPFSSDAAKRDRAPADAATVVLLRDRPSGDDLEILFVRRHQRSAFMAGAYVFPGGRLDAADQAPDALARLPEGAVDACAARLDPTPGHPLPPEAAAGLHVAACRELFEEAGVLLARDPGRAAPAEGPEAWLEARRQVHEGERAFAAVLAESDLHLELDDLAYAAHWITPSFEKRRFDARFFLARFPAGQTARYDAEETVDQKWLTPAQALAAHGAKEIVLPPPTLRTVEDLRAHGTVAEALEAARRRQVAPILPKVGQAGDAMGILLPWDPLYETTEGEGLVLDGPHPMAGEISRVILVDGRWVSRSA